MIDACRKNKENTLIYISQKLYFCFFFCEYNVEIIDRHIVFARKLDNIINRLILF